jgi:hypothetical protein
VRLRCDKHGSHLSRERKIKVGIFGAEFTSSQRRRQEGCELRNGNNDGLTPGKNYENSDQQQQRQRHHRTEIIKTTQNNAKMPQNCQQTTQMNEWSKASSGSSGSEQILDKSQQMLALKIK